MSQDTTKFKVATLNLFNYLAPPNAFYESENIYTSKQWLKKERWIENQLAQWQPDIIGFQEVFSPTELEQLVTRNNYPYFATVDAPSIKELYVYQDPVVALASKFPIASVDRVTVDNDALEDLNLKEGFEFSRLPIKAEITLEGMGNVLIYVLHLKSQRSLLESAINPKEASVPDVAQSMFAQVNGRWASTIQRGIESVLIYRDIMRELSINERPVIVMGDLNDTLDSHAIRPLLGGAMMDKLNNQFVSDFPLKLKRLISRFSLYDAFSFQALIPSGDRKPTHYFAGKGNVLDYILLSRDFDSSYDHSLASVEGFIVSDKHLINPIYAQDSESSDHALVMIEVKTRS